MMGSLASVYERFGDTHRAFNCCDTTFRVQAAGVRADAAVTAAQETAESLEAQLNAFDAASAVSQLNGDGEVANEHVARIVRRGLEYNDRTEGVFDIHQGRVEHDLKTFLRGDSETPPTEFDAGTVRISGSHVTTDVELGLNGLAKGYIVDRASEALGGVGRRGFVSGGGDMSPPTGPVAIESPYGDDTPLKLLDTDWYVATSGGYRRSRNGTDHIYDPTTESLGARHESVTVVARRDCMEADALATTLAALPLAEARELAAEWERLEALIVHDGVFNTTEGFETHVLDT
ncbi:FAD:protein FMN transferase [Haloarcula sp. 1CSR25-25]|jgi:thiamine biosynthesis lipoprotein|uniref:FAD:protein FMN transferase n=1 Tax=Haloarcula sp. 1CSR25-25 TaxID=2862545 RepID=UPI002895741F|nr:FAD:protein FMN transferase [Haloarcula sp. 1CSR25-25]MDT3437704.1 FAD:protein FMN transferase [Haloarcula sp. 1CSR25-25]